MFKSFFIHFILNSLPSKYGTFKISYNIHKEKWSIDELLTICVQEEERLNQERIESAHLVRKVKDSKRHLLIMLIRAASSASFVRRRDTSRIVVLNLRLGLKER